MRTFLTTSYFALAVVVLSSAARAGETEAAPKDLVQASLLADVDAAVPGGSFTLGVMLKMKPHWHTYWINPGETGNATQFVFHAPGGFEVGAVAWPLPAKIESGGGIIYGYDDEVLFLIPVKITKNLPATGSAAISAEITWLSCKDTCIEGSAKLAITLPVSLKAKAVNGELFDTWRKRLPMAINDPAAVQVLASVDQAARGTTPDPVLHVTWKTPVAKVEWFPISTDAALIENVVAKQAGLETHINFKTTVYKAENVPGGRLDSVLVYEDGTGKRHGISVPVAVTKK